MIVPYSTQDPSQHELDSLPWLPLILGNETHEVEVAGLVDSGAMVSVLPYGVGEQLGAVWDDRKAVIRLAGNLGNLPAMPLFLAAQIGDFLPVRLAFAWTQTVDVPLVLGQMNFFMEFEVSFYRARLEFELRRASSAD